MIKLFRLLSQTLPYCILLTREVARTGLKGSERLNEFPKVIMLINSWAISRTQISVHFVYDNTFSPNKLFVGQIIDGTIWWPAEGNLGRMILYLGYWHELLPM